MLQTAPTSQLREKRTVNRKSLDVTRSRSSEGRTRGTEHAPIGRAERVPLQDRADMRSAQPPRRYGPRPLESVAAPDRDFPDRGRIGLRDLPASLPRS